MKNFMRKIYDNHAIKEVALFVGGIITGAALATHRDDERILSEREKEDIFLKRNNENSEIEEISSEEEDE